MATDTDVVIIGLLAAAGVVIIIQGSCGIAAYLQLTQDVHPDKRAHDEYATQVAFLVVGVVLVVVALALACVKYQTQLKTFGRAVAVKTAGGLDAAADFFRPKAAPLPITSESVGVNVPRPVNL